MVELANIDNNQNELLVPEDENEDKFQEIFVYLEQSFHNEPKTTSIYLHRTNTNPSYFSKNRFNVKFCEQPEFRIDDADAIRDQLLEESKYFIQMRSMRHYSTRVEVVIETFTSKSRLYYSITFHWIDKANCGQRTIRRIKYWRHLYMEFDVWKKILFWLYIISMVSQVLSIVIMIVRGPTPDNVPEHCLSAYKYINETCEGVVPPYI